MWKKIGLVGGTSPESTIEYYRHIVHTFYQQFGNYHYPEIIIYSVDFECFIDWSKAGKWDEVAEGLIEAAGSLERAGAEVIALTANTMHLTFDQVQSAVKVPMISILEATGKAAQTADLQIVGLLGTRYTMESEELYPAALEKRGIKVITPDEESRRMVNDVIYGELIKGEIKPESKTMFLKVITELGARGAQGVILGCTEIPLLVKQSDSELTLLDTTRIHSESILEYAINPLRR